MRRLTSKTRIERALTPRNDAFMLARIPALLCVPILSTTPVLKHRVSTKGHQNGLRFLVCDRVPGARFSLRRPRFTDWA